MLRILSLHAAVLATVALFLAATDAAPSFPSAPLTGTAGLADFSSPLLRRDLSAGSGEATYYDPGLGACEATNGPNEMIVALNAVDFGPAVPARSSMACSSCVSITSPTAPNASPIVAKIVDKCPGCKKGDLDLSPAVFKHFHELGKGRFAIQWTRVPCGANAPATPVTPPVIRPPTATPSSDPPMPSAPTQPVPTTPPTVTTVPQPSPRETFGMVPPAVFDGVDE